jgi:hypothetical protein
MKTAYILKKDLPWAKANSIWEMDRSGRLRCTSIPGGDGWVTRLSWGSSWGPFSDWFDQTIYRFKPGMDEIYWLVSDTGEVITSSWDDHTVDRKRLETGNCFESLRQAQDAADGLKAFFDNRK